MPEAHSTTNTPGAANTTRSCSLRGMNADTPNCPMPGPPQIADHGNARHEPRMRPSYRVKRADWKGLGCENHQCPLRVISRHRKGSTECPLYPQKRTWISTAVMSAL